MKKVNYLRFNKYKFNGNDRGKNKKRIRLKKEKFNRLKKVLFVSALIVFFTIPIGFYENSTGIAGVFNIYENNKYEYNETGEEAMNVVIEDINKEPNKKEEFEYKTLIVQSGDTLWNIATDNLPENTDPRKFIYEIRELNEREDLNLQPGEKIKIPK